MLYFSKLENLIINLEHISVIKYVPKEAATGKTAHGIVCFIDGSKSVIDEIEYIKLIQDLDAACSLVKLQKERGEIR